MVCEPANDVFQRWLGMVDNFSLLSEYKITLFLQGLNIVALHLWR